MTADHTAELLSAMATELAAMKNELADVRMRYDMLHKRQMLPLDGGMLAMRHMIGWLIVPQEDFATVVHLSDGVSGHEYGTTEVMRRIVRPGDTVIDLGAHIGLHTIPLGRSVGPNGRVIAVEPMPRTAECLSRALVCNGLFNRCDVVVAAAGDVNGASFFYLGGNSMLGSLYPVVDDHKRIEVREIRLDDYVGEDVRIALVKIDVEGAEIKALDGMRGLIGRNPDIVLIAEYGRTHLERVGINPEDWFAAFAEAGLAAAFMIDEATGSLSEVDLARMSELYSANILFVSDPRRVADIGPGSATSATH